MGCYIGSVSPLPKLALLANTDQQAFITILKRLLARELGELWGNKRLWIVEREPMGDNGINLCDGLAS